MTETLVTTDNTHLCFTHTRTNLQEDSEYANQAVGSTQVVLVVPCEHQRRHDTVLSPSLTTAQNGVHQFSHEVVSNGARQRAVDQQDRIEVPHMAVQELTRLPGERQFVPRVQISESSYALLRLDRPPQLSVDNSGHSQRTGGTTQEGHGVCVQPRERGLQELHCQLQMPGGLGRSVLEERCGQVIMKESNAWRSVCGVCV